MEEKSGFNFNIAYYYELFVFELASEPKIGKPDTDLSLFYVRKTLETENGPFSWGNFVALTWQYLYNSENSLVRRNPSAAAALVPVLMEYLEPYLQADIPVDKKKHRLNGLIQCAETLEKQYLDACSPLGEALTVKERSQKALPFRETAELLRKKQAAL